MLENLVSALFENLEALLPCVIIRSYERGVRWTFGRNPMELQPGLHFKCYFVHSVTQMPTCSDAMPLPIQSVMTSDEKLVCFSAVIGYHIDDVVKHFTQVTDFEKSTIALASVHLAQKVRKQPLAELVGDISKLEKSLENTLTTRFKDWGTVVDYVGFSNFAEVPTQLRIFGETTPLLKQ